MHELEVVELVGTGIITTLLGLLVLSRDWLQKSLQAFLLFCLSVTAWSWGIAWFYVGGFGSSLFWTNFYYAAALSIAVTLQIFTCFWLRTRQPRLAFYLVVPILVLLALIVTLIVDTAFIVESISVGMDGTRNVELSTVGYGIYTLAFLVLYVSAILRLARMAKRLTGLYRTQTKYIVTALLIAGAFGVTFNLVLPWFGDQRFIWLGPLSAVIFTGFIGFAIVKKKLFDVRLVVARTVGYVVTVALLASIYGLVVFGLANYVFNLGVPVYAQIWLSAATGLTCLVFPASKKQLERLTNKIFYRDAYDSQTLYDRLNQNLVASTTMENLLMRSLSILETSLKPDFAFVSLKSEGGGYRIFGTRKVFFDEDDMKKARQQVAHLHSKVIVADYIDESNPRAAELKAIMSKNNLAVLVRLTHNVRSVEQGLGYLVLGYKRSGNIYSRQDVEVLDTIANELVIAIQNALHTEEIQQFNLTLQKRIDEATRRLRQTNRRLKLLDETKDDFISMASHQLRTPLTSVKGYISMVLEGDAGKINKQQRTMLEQSFASSQRMVYLIADLLNVSRLKTGKFVIQSSEVYLPDMIEQEIDQLRVSADSRDMTISFKKPKNFPKLMLDETKIRQVIMNFVDNAIYYTPAGGKIRVELTADETAARLKVVDNGIGVPKAEQHRLFTKFYRAPNARSVRPDGTGLGLFMANKVVLAQGGHIIFHSTEGRGSTFGFSFPLKAKSLQPAVASPPSE